MEYGTITNIAIFTWKLLFDKNATLGKTYRWVSATKR